MFSLWKLLRTIFELDSYYCARENKGPPFQHLPEEKNKTFIDLYHAATIFVRFHVHVSNIIGPTLNARKATRLFALPASVWLREFVLKKKQDGCAVIKVYKALPSCPLSSEAVYANYYNERLCNSSLLLLCKRHFLISTAIVHSYPSSGENKPCLSLSTKPQCPL